MMRGVRGHGLPRAILGALLLVVFLAFAASPAYSAEYGALRKTGRGLASVTTGFLEIPGNMVKGTREEGYAYGLTVGFAKGIGRFVVREVVGVYELLSAPFAAPRGFVPLLEPEFPWGYFEEPPPSR